MRLTPQQNGLAERTNITLMDKVRSMLVQFKLPKGLKSLPFDKSKSLNHWFKNTYEMWSGQPVNYESLRAFGCPVYALWTKGNLLQGIWKVSL